MNKDIEELAKAVFLKSYNAGTYLTEKTEQHAISTVKNAIDVATLFYKVLNESKVAYVKTPEDEL